LLIYTDKTRAARESIQTDLGNQGAGDGESLCFAGKENKTKLLIITSHQISLISVPQINQEPLIL
jgi:hypothetical protein